MCTRPQSRDPATSPAPSHRLLPRKPSPVVCRKAPNSEWSPHPRERSRKWRRTRAPCWRWWHGPPAASGLGRRRRTPRTFRPRRAGAAFPPPAAPSPWPSRLREARRQAEIPRLPVSASKSAAPASRLRPRCRPRPNRARQGRSPSWCGCPCPPAYPDRPWWNRSLSSSTPFGRGIPDSPGGRCRCPAAPRGSCRMRVGPSAGSGSARGCAAFRWRRFRRTPQRCRNDPPSPSGRSPNPPVPAD